MAGEISEDGKWVWDGSEWQPVVSSPPSAPPTTTALPSVQEGNSELVSELEAAKAEIARKEKERPELEVLARKIFVSLDPLLEGTKFHASQHIVRPLSGHFHHKEQILDGWRMELRYLLENPEFELPPDFGTNDFAYIEGNMYFLVGFHDDGSSLETNEPHHYDLSLSRTVEDIAKEMEQDMEILRPKFAAYERRKDKEALKEVYDEQGVLSKMIVGPDGEIRSIHGTAGKFLDNLWLVLLGAVIVSGLGVMMLVMASQ